MTTEQETEPDWAARQTDRVIDVIDKVKAQTTDRAVTVLRAIVFGVVIAVLGVAAATIFLVAVVRMADAYLPIGAGVGDATWAAHLFAGSLLSILGLGAWLSRVPARGHCSVPRSWIWSSSSWSSATAFQLSWSTLKIPDPS